MANYSENSVRLAHELAASARKNLARQISHRDDYLQALDAYDESQMAALTNLYWQWYELPQGCKTFIAAEGHEPDEGESIEHYIVREFMPWVIWGQTN